jgi:PAS domain S-box-containing protein
MSAAERKDEVQGPTPHAQESWPTAASDTPLPLRSSEGDTLFRALFAAHPLPMWVYDLETLRFLEVNDAAVALYGYSRDEFLGMRITEIRPPDEVEPLQSFIDRAIRLQRTPYRASRSWKHVRKDGELRDVEVSAHDLAFGGRDAVLVMVTDITDRLRAERDRDALLARLRQEASEKAAILEQMVDAVLVAEGSGRIVLANRAAHELFDFYGAEWPRLGHGTPPLTRLPWNLFDAQGDEIPPHQRPFARALRGETTRTEVRIVTESGRESWVWISASPLRDEQGNVAGVVWLGHETTEERGRREREAQGEKLRALGQLASGVAHDLNQYLGLVAGYGDLTARAIDGAAPDLTGAREALEVVVRAAMDGSETVNRLLSFARPAQEGPAETVEIGGLLREVAMLTAPRWRDDAQHAGGPIGVTVKVTGDTTIKGWPSSLREAFTNLVFNAIDAMPSGGTIHLAARQEGDQVIASVTDSGVGIPAEALRHVFEPFFTTKGTRGTGLGLAIVYGIAERHQGTVSISSPPGQGTTVLLTCPSGAVAPPPLVRPVEARPRTGLRILVVDDEPAITRMVAMMLGPHGHDVTTAMSGEEALGRLHDADAPFDLILSDLGLGDGMNGWDLLEHVRGGASNARFILSTGWGAQIDQDEVVARGGERLLPKPYRLSDLLAAVAGPA